MKKKLIWWFLIIVWCAFIFYESSNNGADSGKQSIFVLHLLKKAFGNLHISEYLIRKSAHFSEYLILGCLLFKGFYRDKLVKAILFSSLAGVLYAASDEIHQYFIPGRASRFFDVIIDSSGLLSAILIMGLLAWKADRTKVLEGRDNSGKV